MHLMRNKRCFLSISQVAQKLIVGEKLALINLTQGSSMNDTLLLNLFHIAEILVEVGDKRNR
ncbi:hypothetical protein EPI10_008985 [Gossypium australe]|uniref:Uncharacterized protein n=1 Tax=Gossypium australe TaxID=47621 RepID=A0A5B6U7P9_9ROSI|nr:hypothetical protein EPI10_008985 [Gossypium australe]